MTERENLILARGKAIFGQENKDPNAIFELELERIGALGSKKSAKVAIDAERRIEFLRRAEQELIDKGTILGPPVYGD